MKNFFKAFFSYIVIPLILASITLVAIAYYVTDANAAEVEIDVGVSRYVDGQDGWWYQQALPHTLRMTAPAVEVSLHDTVWQSDQFGLDANIGWQYLGQMHTQGWAVADSNYDPTHHTCVVSCGHQSDFNGSGHDQGLRLTLEPTYTVDGYKFGVEAGAYVHMNTWSEHILDWSNDNNAAPGAGHVLDVSADHKWLLGSVVGASVTHGNFVLKYQYFKNASPVLGVAATDFPAAWHSTHVVSIGYNF